MRVYYNPYEFQKAVIDFSTSTFIGAMAYSDYMAKQADKLNDVISSITSSTGLTDRRLVSFDIDGVVYWTTVSTIANAFQNDGSGEYYIPCFDSRNNDDTFSLSDVLSSIVDQAHVDSVMSSVGRYIASAAGTLHSADLLSIIQTSGYPDLASSIGSSIIQSLSGLSPTQALAVLFSTADSYSNPALSPINFDDYGESSWSLAKAILDNVFDQAVNVFNQAIENIDRLKDVFKQLASGVVSAISSVAQYFFNDVFNDFEVVNDANWSGSDFPICQFQWESIDTLSAWLDSAIQHMSGKFMTSVNSGFDDAYFNSKAVNACHPRETKWLCPSSRFDTSVADPDVISGFIIALQEKRVITALAGGMVNVFSVMNDGSVIYHAYISGFTYDSATFALAVYDDSFSGGSCGGSFNSNIRPIKVDSQDVYASLYTNNDSYKLLYSTPVFYNGHLTQVSSSSDLYSKFTGGAADVNQFVKYVAENSNLHLSGMFTDNWDANFEFNTGHMILQSLAVFTAISVGCAAEGIEAPFYAFSYTTTGGVQVRAVLDKENERTSLPKWFPYATVGAGTFQFHLQSNAERAAEIKTALVRVACAAAIATTAVVAVKAVRKLKTTVAVRKSILTDKMLNVDLGSPDDVKDLMRAQRAYNRSSGLLSLLTGNSASVAVSSLLSGLDTSSESYALNTALYKLISGVVPQV